MKELTVMEFVDFDNGEFRQWLKQNQDMNIILNNKRKRDWDNIDHDIKYQRRELKRIGGNIDEARA